MKTLLKTNCKLLFRTKAFWFFLLLTPLLSTLILKIKFDSSAAYTNNYNREIIELSDASQKVAYHGGKGEYVIKVYDASGSDKSDYLLQRIAETGLFLVCRVDISGEKNERDFIEKRIKKDGFLDKMGAAMFIPASFDQDSSVTLYVLSDDGREAALESEISYQLDRISQVGDTEILKEMDGSLPDKEIISVAGGVGRNLDRKQINQRSQIGYAFAFMTLGFVFCGIFVSHTSIKEQRNGVFTRLSLTRTSSFRYFASKFLTAIIVSMILTMVMALYSFLLNEDDLGMGRLKFICMIFMMGIIFSTLSMLLGIFMGDVMSANVAAFTVWCISAMMSGLYFPLNYTSKGLKMISYLMPQKWFLDGTEMIFVGDNKAFFMILCVTVAYLIVILSLGSLGLRLKRTDEWGND